MDLLQSAQTLLRRTQYLYDRFNPVGSSDTISAVADHIVNFLLPPSTSTSASSTFSTLNTIHRDYINPYILAPLQYLLSGTSSSASSGSNTTSGGMPDLAFNLTQILTLITVAFISLRVLNYVRKVVMWWIMLAVKLGLILVAVQLGLYISQYGWEKTLTDAGWLWGLLEGFLGETGTQMGGSTGSRATTAGTRGRGRQQAPLGSTRGSRGRWS